jgi:hypothetical protein
MMIAILLGFVAASGTIWRTPLDAAEERAWR